MTSPFVSVDRDAPRYVDTVDSPIGELLLTGRGDALTGLHMLAHPAGYGRPDAPPATDAGWARHPSAFGSVVAQLRAYFAGELTEFDAPLAPSGSPFQLAVWAALTRIRYGTTVSYGEIAHALGKTGAAARAVGAANGQNPIAIIVPCHRVIGANGDLVGYGGGLDRKRWLLRLEGSALC